MKHCENWRLIIAAFPKIQDCLKFNFEIPKDLIGKRIPRFTRTILFLWR
jgi:hypothetical protein